MAFFIHAEKCFVITFFSTEKCKFTANICTYKCNVLTINCTNYCILSIKKTFQKKGSIWKEEYCQN